MPHQDTVDSNAVRDQDLLDSLSRLQQRSELGLGNIPKRISSGDQASLGLAKITQDDVPEFEADLEIILQQEAEDARRKTLQERVQGANSVLDDLVGPTPTNDLADFMKLAGIATGLFFNPAIGIGLHQGAKFVEDRDPEISEFRNRQTLLPLAAESLFDINKAEFAEGAAARSDIRNTRISVIREQIQVGTQKELLQLQTSITKEINFQEAQLQTARESGNIEQQNEASTRIAELTAANQLAIARLNVEAGKEQLGTKIKSEKDLQTEKLRIEKEIADARIALSKATSDADRAAIQTNLDTQLKAQADLQDVKGVQALKEIEERGEFGLEASRIEAGKETSDKIFFGEKMAKGFVRNQEDPEEFIDDLINRLIDIDFSGDRKEAIVTLADEIAADQAVTGQESFGPEIQQGLERGLIQLLEKERRAKEIDLQDNSRIKIMEKRIRTLETKRNNKTLTKIEKEDLKNARQTIRNIEFELVELQALIDDLKRDN